MQVTVIAVYKVIGENLFKDRVVADGCLHFLAWDFASSIVIRKLLREFGLLWLAVEAIGGVGWGVRWVVWLVGSRR